MERNLRILLAFFALLLGLSPFTIVAPWIGLSTILGIFVLSSSVLGSSVLGSSVLASTTIVEAYAGAVVASQLWLSLVAIGLLVYLELSDPTYGVFRKSLVELRRSWLPVTALLVILFSIIVALKVYTILAG